MPAFHYEALDQYGTETRGVTESDSARLARASLRESGLTVVSIREVRNDSSRQQFNLASLWSFRSKIPASQISQLTRQMAILLSAGLSLEQTLDALIAQSESESVRQVFASIRAEVLAGGTLAQAFSRHESVFPKFYPALVKAGESSGELDLVMLKLADYTEARQALRQKVGLAFVYPLIVTFVALLVIGGLLLYVVPQVVQVFQQSRQDLPLLTTLLIGLSDILKVSWPYLFLLILFAIFWIRWLWQQEPKRFQIEQRLLRAPLIGRLLRSSNTERMASTLAILVSSGVPLLGALNSAANVMNNLPMRKALLEAAHKVSEGSGLSRALSGSGLFPPILIHLIASGEASGRLGVLLERAAKQQAQEVENFTSMLTALLEPILVLTMGVIVLLIVLAILLPIIDLNQMVR